LAGSLVQTVYPRAPQKQGEDQPHFEKNMENMAIHGALLRV
jgi:hypothetical protein